MAKDKQISSVPSKKRARLRFELCVRGGVVIEDPEYSIVQVGDADLVDDPFTLEDDILDDAGQGRLHIAQSSGFATYPDLLSPQSAMTAPPKAGF